MLESTERDLHSLFIVMVSSSQLRKKAQILTSLILSGGPTSAAGKGLNWSIQYFTSRGFAYVGMSSSSLDTNSSSSAVLQMLITEDRPVMEETIDRDYKDSGEL